MYRVIRATDCIRYSTTMANFNIHSPMTGEFPAQIASNAENVSIWWRHDEYLGKKWHYPNPTNLHPRHNWQSRDTTWRFPEGTGKRVRRLCRQPDDNQARMNTSRDCTCAERRNWSWFRSHAKWGTAHINLRKSTYVIYSDVTWV